VSLADADGRDAEMTAACLGDAGIQVDPCGSIDECCEKVRMAKASSLLPKSVLPNTMNVCSSLSVSTHGRTSAGGADRGGSAAHEPVNLNSIERSWNVTLLNGNRVITLLSAIQSASLTPEAVSDA